MMNRDLNSPTCSSVSPGRWAMSMTFPFRAARYMTVATATGVAAIRAAGRVAARPASLLLRVELDDELFLDERVNLRPDRERVHPHPHLVPDDLDPGRRGALSGLGARDDEGGQLPGLGRYLDDVALAHPVGRDVHLPAVDHDVPVRHELAGHVPALGEAGPVDDVVQPGFQQLEERLAGHAALA